MILHTIRQLFESSIESLLTEIQLAQAFGRKSFQNKSQSANEVRQRRICKTTVNMLIL